MRINDSLILGMVSGFGGTVVKNVAMQVMKNLNWAEFDGVETSAGVFMPGHKITSTSGRIVGHVANFTVGAMVGTVTVYVLSKTGEDKAILKGAAMGGISWLSMYGYLGGTGATNVKPTLPKTVLCQYISHMAFGVATSYLATSLGRPGVLDKDACLPNSRGNRAPTFIKKEGKKPPNMEPRKIKGKISGSERSKQSSFV